MTDTPASGSKLHWRRDKAAQALSAPSVAADWDRLSKDRGDLPFMTAAAVCNALEVFGTGQEVLVTGTQGGHAVAMFVLVEQGALRWQTFQASQMPLGCWVALRGMSLVELTESLIRAPVGLCLALSVTQVDPLYAPRAGDDSCVAHSDYIDTAWIDVAGSFDDYWAARGKNLRQNMRKQRNKLAAENTTTQMRVLREVADMGPALSRYGVLESAGWKAGQGTAIHADNAQGRFYLRLLEDGAARREAVVYEYLFGERTVAMNLCLLRAGQLVVLKTTYDESIKTLSPAFLLREEELQAIFGGSEIRRIEYFGRLMDWHTKLTDNKRAVYHLTRYRWPWVKRLALRRRHAAATTSANAATSEEASA